ncbi:hypothetical protein P168DRAFT_325303 [Aspergillus campestris IBT 28561]|uniref:Uncharacterized protein n=1 Tax=Aspergillus campestris (strain IBT 28561) TaxID=1392248 RepID=A0A2I1D990_ASPC2|nr:uncharacterized protein P168DRAFT_325303 [Aspergillus campestris IBT 28561]PKY06435.1 hypothetical protein P168DRAFT_325303 [Aspergillus campestris IBT 28561]
MLRLIPLLCLSLIWLGMLGSAAPLWKRQTPATDGDFNIYAYGENISGLPLYSADGHAHIGDPAASDANQKGKVHFSKSSQSSQKWVAHTDNTTSDQGESTAASTSTSTLSLNDDGTVGFTDSDDSDNFSAYGNYVMIQNRENVYYYALPTGKAGQYSLRWSESAQPSDSGRVPVVLRTTPPATDVILRKTS